MKQLKYFLFQAEDGIRDYKVTGVQTCALPIFCRLRLPCRSRSCAGPAGPVWPPRHSCTCPARRCCRGSPSTRPSHWASGRRDRKSTRLNSSHLVISYAVFCLKKKKKCYSYCLIEDVKCHIHTDVHEC